MCINGASTSFALASGRPNGKCTWVNPESSYQPLLWTKMLWMSSLPPSNNEHHQSVNNSLSCILDSLRAMEWHWPTSHQTAACMGNNGSDDITSAPLNWRPTVRQQWLWGLSMWHTKEMHHVAAKLSFTQSVFVICSWIQFNKYAYDVLQMWPVFACSARIYIWGPTLCFTISYHSVQSWSVLRSISIRTVMLDSLCLHTSCLEVVISSNNERVPIHDLSDCTLQIMFDA
jgi:hypothetical protein